MPPSTPPTLTRADVRQLTVLALDHGEKRIGLALKPAGGEVVVPLGIAVNGSVIETIESIRRILQERQVQLVVVGLPLDENPSQAAKVKRFTRRLREEVKAIRWRFVDESLSTRAAEALAKQSGKREVRSVDDLAAVVILQSYLESL